MCEVEVWIVIDENGDYAVAATQEAAVERFADEVGGELATRQVKVTLKVPLPKPLEMTGEVPAEPEGAELRVA